MDNLGRYSDNDLFKYEFKYFKRKKPKPDLSDVIDFDNYANFNNIRKIENPHLDVQKHSAGKNDSESSICTVCEYLGLQNHNNWNIYSVTDKEGFLFIRNPFLKSGQQMWITKCIESYPKKPNKTNLDAHFSINDDIWTRKWSESSEKEGYMSKLRWTTLGYHHNWDTKVYSHNSYSEFPVCLKELSQHTAAVIGFSEYQPEAAIVNYYKLDSSLGGHVDNSEIDQTAPLLSFSFGQTAVFLLGCENKCERPIPVFIRSGDIMIMSGSCRLVYHAMPLIIQDAVSERYNLDASDQWHHTTEYLNVARINVNVRQVFPNDT